MNSALVYLVERFFWRIWDFLNHWYRQSFRVYGNTLLNFLNRVDYYLAWKITWRYLFQPLYKDYTILGYILGFVFRSGRLVLSSAIYFLIFLFAAALFVFWLIIPPLLLYLIFKR